MEGSKISWGLLLARASCAPQLSNVIDPYGVPDERAQSEIKRRIVQKKLDDVLSGAMRAHGINMWIVIDRENNEEPLHDEVGGGYPGVRGAYIFYDRGEDGVEKLFFGSHEQPSTAIVPHLYDSVSYYGYNPAGLVRDGMVDSPPGTTSADRDRGRARLAALQGRSR